MRMTLATLGRSLLAAFGWFVIAYVVYESRRGGPTIARSNKRRALDIVLGRFGSPTPVEEFEVAAGGQHASRDFTSSLTLMAGLFPRAERATRCVSNTTSLSCLESLCWPLISMRGTR